MNDEPSIVPEAFRDEVESGFTKILRELRAEVDHALAVVFVDREGETIDYSSLIDVFDTKIAGAALVPAMRVVREAVVKLAGGEVRDVTVHGTERDLIVRRMDDEFCLVMICRGGSADEPTMELMGKAMEALRLEAGFEAPVWDGSWGPLEVDVRGAVGWDYAPASFRHRDRRATVTDVLGRWEETGGAVGGTLVCFRVLIDSLEEVTLAHDARLDLWYEWTH